MTKYCTDSSYGTVDNKTTLEAEDDVAHVKWGGSWRMPTKTEWEELINNCTWEWTTQSDVNGYKVTSKQTGYTDKSIFLPVTGYYSDSGLDFTGRCYYWSSSLYTKSRSASDVICYNAFYDNINTNANQRYSGIAVRPVLAE